MTDQPTELLTIDPADTFLVLIVPRDGEGIMLVSSDVDDAKTAEWLHQVADHVATGQHRPQPLPTDDDAE